MSNLAQLTIKDKERQVAKAICRYYFKDDYDNPFELTDTQADLFMSIYLKRWQRNQIIAPTQWGKSSTIAMAVTLRSQHYSEDWGIVTGSQPKSQIIMDKVIQHSFDHPDLYRKIQLDPNEPLDRLRRSRTRTQLSWLGGGGVKTFTADSRNRQRVKESLTGFGSPNIIEDEASLIPNDIQAMILRMLGGHNPNFLLKIGNPFYANHFKRTWQDPRYNRIFIDYLDALAEGRYTQDFIDEMKAEPFFDVLYECRFPDDDEELPNGYRRLIPGAYIDNAFIDAPLPIVEGDKPIIGVDIARGGDNQSVYVIRYPKSGFARILEKNNSDDLMEQVEIIKKYHKEYNIQDYRIAIDDTGVGGGVSDRLRQEDILVLPVKVGLAANDSTRYANLKAEMFWRLGNWIKNENGKLLRDSGFLELKVINYKETTSSKLQIEPKLDLLKRGVKSPDTADALMLTCIDTTRIVEEEDIDII